MESWKRPLAVFTVLAFISGGPMAGHASSVTVPAPECETDEPILMPADTVAPGPSRDAAAPAAAATPPAVPLAWPGQCPGNFYDHNHERCFYAPGDVGETMFLLEQMETAEGNPTNSTFPGGGTMREMLGMGFTPQQVAAALERFYHLATNACGLPYGSPGAFEVQNHRNGADVQLYGIGLTDAQFNALLVEPLHGKGCPGGGETTAMRIAACNNTLPADVSRFAVDPYRFPQQTYLHVPPMCGDGVTPIPGGEPPPPTVVLPIFGIGGVACIVPRGSTTARCMFAPGPLGDALYDFTVLKGKAFIPLPPGDGLQAAMKMGATPMQAAQAALHFAQTAQNSCGATGGGITGFNWLIPGAGTGFVMSNAGAMAGFGFGMTPTQFDAAFTVPLLGQSCAGGGETQAIRQQACTLQQFSANLITVADQYAIDPWKNPALVNCCPERPAGTTAYVCSTP